MRTFNKWSVAALAFGLPVAAILPAMLWSPLSSTLRPPERIGQAMLVLHEGKPRLWVVLKQEESRQVRWGGGSRSTGGFRNDSFFHFDIQAHDTGTARPAWKTRIQTIGDSHAEGSRPSRVIGSSASARLLGQDGATVWMFINDQPVALSAADGSLQADAATLQQRNPSLKGMLPASTSFYAFDGGLVVTAADAQLYRVRGGSFEATPYQPPPPPGPAPATRWMSTRPMGEPVVRQARIDGNWLGLYTEREAADAGSDQFGTRYNEPFTVFNEGPLARRTFWRARIGKTREFTEGTHDRLFDLAPVPGAATYLRGRFVHVPGAEQPLALASPAGLLVQHHTRIDAEGRVAITRIDAALKPLWTATLPVTELGARWISPKQLLLLGTEQTQRDGLRTREEVLLALDLADGKMRSWNLQAGEAGP